VTRVVPTAGVMGWPVAHSQSPLIHRFWLEALGLAGDYARLPVPPGRLGGALAALAPLGLAGVNLTVPHKVAALAHLDSLDPAARAVGAVNTVLVGDGGRLHGTNTDVAGIIEALAPRRFAHVVLLGAGGAARAAVAALGALGAGRLTICNRSAAAAEALLAASGLPGEVRPLEGATPAADLLVNATSLGMAGQPPLEVAIGGAPLVFDMVYAPLETPLLAGARARGLETVDGLAMLIGQAARAFQLFYGAEPPRARDAELRALLAGR
jgi:shikimate dehydrogenase